jgi:hypothetical protein
MIYIQTETNRCIPLDGGYSIFFEGDWEREVLIQHLTEMRKKDPAWEPSWISWSNSEWTHEEFDKFHNNLLPLKEKIMEEKQNQYLD